MEEAGAFGAASLHYVYEQWSQYGRRPPEFLADVWTDYLASVEEMPEERRHLRVHQGHNCWVAPEDEPFVTQELLEATCLIGTRGGARGAAAGRCEQRGPAPGHDPAVARSEGAGSARRRDEGDAAARNPLTRRQSAIAASTRPATTTASSASRLGAVVVGRRRGVT